MDTAITTTSRNEKRGSENTLGENLRRCPICGYTERVGIPGITYGRIGPYSGICWDCLIRIVGEPK